MFSAIHTVCDTYIGHFPSSLFLSSTHLISTFVILAKIRVNYPLTYNHKYETSTIQIESKKIISTVHTILTNEL